MTKGSPMIQAAPFSDWLKMTQKAISNSAEAKVPCGDCSACCTSAFFIAVRKDETITLGKIPEDLLNEIPGIPDLYYLGFNELGHCHLLVDGLCSIYDHRPHSCRTFDCRVYTATGINLDKENNSPINIRINEWQFSYPTQNDRIQHENLLKAVSILKNNLDLDFSGPTSDNRRLFALYAIQNTDSTIKIWNEKSLELLEISKSENS